MKDNGLGGEWADTNGFEVKASLLLKTGTVKQKGQVITHFYKNLCLRRTFNVSESPC